MKNLYVFLVIFLFSTICWAQNKNDIVAPSQAELTELTNSFSEQVVAFDKIVTLVKPLLPDTIYQKDEQAIAFSNELISRLHKTNNISAEMMVLLLSVADDLALCSAQTAAAIELEYVLHLSQNKSDTKDVLLKWTLCLNASSSFYDISDLILKATLRYVNAEEEFLEEINKLLTSPT